MPCNVASTQIAARVYAGSAFFIVDVERRAVGTGVHGWPSLVALDVLGAIAWDGEDIAGLIAYVGLTRYFGASCQGGGLRCRAWGCEWGSLAGEDGVLTGRQCDQEEGGDAGDHF